MKLERFWQTIESIPGLAAVTTEWQDGLGDEYDILKRFLRPTGEIAESYPRKNDISYRVVCHGPDDYVGVCPDGGGTVPLEKADLIIYKLRTRSLIENIAKALNIDCQIEEVLALSHTWRVGFVDLPEAKRSPVFRLAVIRWSSKRYQVGPSRAIRRQP